MKQIEPIVVKLAETGLNAEGVRAMAEHYGAVEWLNRAKELQPNESEFLIELAGRTPVTAVLALA